MLHLLNVGKNKEIITGHFFPIRLAGEYNHRSLDAWRQSSLRPARVGQPENHTTMLIQQLTHPKHRNKQMVSDRGEKKSDRGTYQEDKEKKNKWHKASKMQVRILRIELGKGSLKSAVD